MKRTLKQRILDEMIIKDSFLFEITKELYLKRHDLNKKYQELSFDELYREVERISKELKE